VRPGIIAGMIFAFLQSFGDVPISMFLIDPRNNTLPLAIMAYLEYNIDPTVAAISALVALAGARAAVRIVPRAGRVIAVASVVMVGVTKRYRAVVALDDVSPEVASGEFVTVLGASGWGKSTTLRAVAGLTSIDAGRVLIDGREVTGVPTAKRNIGMVFQNLALFPHMTVDQNVAFGLRMRRLRAARNASGSGKPWRRCGSTTWAGATRTSFRATSSASRLHGRWSSTRRYCCSTSHSRHSTANCAMRSLGMGSAMAPASTSSAPAGASWPPGAAAIFKASKS
jgi:hypothetical protein